MFLSGCFSLRAWRSDGRLGIFCRRARWRPQKAIVVESVLMFPRLRGPRHAGIVFGRISDLPPSEMYVGSTSSHVVGASYVMDRT